ncbi:hypothetical protein [Bacillus sp. NPDC094106]
MESIKDMEKRIESMFSKMSDAEFDKLLKDAGFEVIQGGNGEIIFTNGK